MNRDKRIHNIRRFLGETVSVVLAVLANNAGLAYETYSGGVDGGCIDCHQDFRGSYSPKGTVFPGNKNHDMHNDGSSMNTDCNLCHFGSGRKPVYTWKSNGTSNTAGNGYGCSGCHVGAGLRAHHITVGETICLDCHVPETPDPENVNPPYYTGVWTSYTKVRNPGNTVLAANTNENWSVGDFLGLDNDGNGLRDAADYAIGPFRILSTAREGNNLRITWETAGGRINTVQAAGKASGTYTNLSGAISIPGIGIVTTNYLEVGGATKGTHFYRLKSQYP